jgi:hypothetical protein
MVPKQLERDLLRLLEERGPCRLESLFEGLRPRWAVEAADQCEVKGLLRELADGRLELLPIERAHPQGVERGTSPSTYSGLPR